MKKCMYYLGVMLVTLGCNSSEEKQPESATQGSVAPTKTPAPEPKSDCSKTLRGKEVRQVKIYCNGAETGTGGIYTENGIRYLITASHIFPKGRTAYFSTITDKDTLYATRTCFNHDDAVIMELSMKKDSLKGFSLFKNDASQKGGWSKQMLFKNKGGKKIFSICGTEYNHIGYFLKEPGFKYAGLIVKKQSIPGESGTVFYDEDNNLYVMSQIYVADDDEGYRINGIQNGDQISFLRPIGFGITISETGVKTSVSW